MATVAILAIGQPHAMAADPPDTTPPDTHMTAGPKGPTNDTTPSFGFVSESGATFECQVDGAAFAACASPFTTAPLADGAHSFAVYATDAAGNPDATPATRDFSVDTVAPQTSITNKPAKTGTKAKLKIVFTSNEPTATFRCSLDGFAYAPCTSPLKLKLGYGRHTVLVRATDEAGNPDPTPAKVKYRRVKR
jgi:hypothetical protein